MTYHINDEAFMASSFIDFHTQEPESPGDYIPMTEDEAREQWDDFMRDVRVEQLRETAEVLEQFHGEYSAGAVIRAIAERMENGEFS